ncbi:hypothetical protein ASE85_21895 [Sphingobium sp. Leaf26]|uniref:hypothetical protein n=1 Tax=Sphingobium sp. Leaf26 TaxID=1735693 RepID=UPI0006F86CBD|nr:hypothetical protein [Sphingobium sp. Leaf26]KQN01222.1 hypothetical protein ASE85_21895 [Sphingobium sp. Leaf26]
MDEDLSLAIIAYLGYGSAAYPQTDWQAVVASIGMARANAVEISMLALLQKLRAISTDWAVHSLSGGSEWAVRQIRSDAAISDRAAKALVWLYSFENK